MLICKDKDITISKKLKMATTFVDRLIGLMFKEKMKSFDAILFSPGKSIHTCFMKFNLDIIFLDKNNKVLKIIRNMKPWRMTKLYLKASIAIEFKAGTLDKRISINDKLSILEQKCLS